LFRGSGYDFTIGVGLGNVLDMAKAASVAITNPDSITHYVDVDKFKKGMPPRS